MPTRTAVATQWALGAVAPAALVATLMMSQPAQGLEFANVFVSPGSSVTVLARPDQLLRVDLWSDGDLVDPPEYLYTARECDYYWHGTITPHFSCRQNFIDWGIAPVGAPFTFHSDDNTGEYWVTWLPTATDVGTRKMNVTALFETTVERMEYDGCMPSCVGGHWQVWDGSVSTATADTRAVEIVVTDVAIEKIEITQSIQESRTPLELRDHLAVNGGDAPVPLVAEKAGALRVFLSEVQVPTPVRVDLWALNVSDPTGVIHLDSKDADLLPGCTADERRSRVVTGTKHCRSVDFRFAPGLLTEGTWAIWVGLAYRVDPGEQIIEPHHLDLDGSLSAEWAAFVADYGYLPGTDPDGSPHGLSLLPAPGGSGNLQTNGELEDFKFVVEVWATDAIVIHGVSVCDLPSFCEPVRRIKSMSRLFKKLAPTSDVRVGTWRDRIDGVYQRPPPTGRAPRCEDGQGYVVPWTDPTPIHCEGQLWWDRVLLELHRLRAVRQALYEQAGEKHAVYGVVADDVSENIGQAYALGSWVAASRSSAIVHGREANVGAFSHEMGHAMGLPHTGVGEPGTATYPGCFGLAERSSFGPRAWPYQTNHLQSGTPGSGGAGEGLPEVGYDYARDRVRARGGLRESYEMMSYCTPMWSTPWSTRWMIETIGPTAATVAGGSSATAAAAPASVFGAYWTLSGGIGQAGASLMPLVERTLDGPGGPGSGTYRVEARDAGGAVLAARWFEPAVAQREVADVVEWSEPAFAVLLPVVAGASRIVVVDDLGADIGSVDLAGAPPGVTLVSPSGGEVWPGLQSVSWTVSDPDSTDSQAFIEYSADGGTTWHQVVDGTRENPRLVDFDELPGSVGQSVVRVSVSDGAHTTTVVSSPFSVPKKLPVAEILDPQAGDTFHLGDSVTLEGAAFDYEDGALSAASLAWSVVGLGTIGTGEELAIDVDQAGSFTLVLTATDGDGNVATDSVDVDVLPAPDVEQSAGRPPVADAGGAYSAVEGVPALVSGAASFDPDGGSLLFGWDFGGGTTATGESATHGYADDGVYTVDLVVIDGELLTDTASATVSVENQPPLVDVTWSHTGDPGVPLLLQANFGDPGPLDAPWTVTWSFGDASPPASYQTGSPGPVAQGHTYATDGVYFATVTVQDKDGGSSTGETVVYVPEPARALAGIVGALGLRWLARRRRRE